MKGEEVIRVTTRQDEYGEAEEWICNECRFEKKDLKYWNVEGPRHIDRHSVISLNHYENEKVEQNLVNTTQVLEQKQIEDNGR